MTPPGSARNRQLLMAGWTGLTGSHCLDAWHVLRTLRSHSAVFTMPSGHMGMTCCGRAGSVDGTHGPITLTSQLGIVCWSVPSASAGGREASARLEGLHPVLRARQVEQRRGVQHRGRIVALGAVPAPDRGVEQHDLFDLHPILCLSEAPAGEECQLTPSCDPDRHQRQIFTLPYLLSTCSEMRHSPSA